MPTKRGGYFLKSGDRVPSVTTIIGNCKIGGIDPLLHWANQEGLEGRNYRDSRQAAADAGTCAHDRVDCHIHKREVDRSKYPDDVWNMSEGPFSAYLEWAGQNKMELVAGEVSLVSEKYRYGGTLDAIALKDKLILTDWKTGAGVYPEYLIQVRAYGELWNENSPDYQVEGYFIGRFSKQKTADVPISFSTHYYKHLDQAWEAFLRMRELYDLSKILKDMT